ncbi:hypothetical protein AVEN_43187-1 [Araneus ventricosus]|uniref:Reverse transcriptase domain-containing protein n=1 Tax=Araneus ventricosus TaxID=182803 RepID=A0A4Y2EZ66_ARAVE|nr:hypothetical protein AVEN_43187-1 [Araneus ventricosus]
MVFLSNFQSGFRYGRGTIDNVLMLETAIRDAFVTKKYLVSVFFDMDKAYDRTWRYGILKDMHDMGFRGKFPIFIKKILKTRTFQVRIGDILSQNFQQCEGVPQGSVLSVILFIIKLNGIINHLPQYVHSSLYVDDLQICCASVNMSFIERQLQTAVLQILDPVYHLGLRLASGAFRTSPVHSLYVICGVPCFKFRRQTLYVKYYFRIKSDSEHPMYDRVLQPLFGTFYSNKKSYIPSFGHRMRLLIQDLNMENVDIIAKEEETPPWTERNTAVIDDFSKQIKSLTPDSVYLQLFYSHR